MDEEGGLDQTPDETLISTRDRRQSSSPAEPANLDDVLPYRGILRTPSSNMSLEDGYSCCQVMPFCFEEALFEDYDYLGTHENVYQCKSVIGVPNSQQLPVDEPQNTIPTTTELDGEEALDWQKAMNNDVPVIRTPDNAELPEPEPRESVNRNTKFQSCPLRLIIHVNNAGNDGPAGGNPEDLSENRSSYVKCDHGSQIHETMADVIPKDTCISENRPSYRCVKRDHGSQTPETMSDDIPKDLSEHPQRPLHVIIHAENEGDAGDTREDLSEHRLSSVKCDQGSQFPDIPTTMSAPSTPKTSNSSKKPSSDLQESYPIEKSPRENGFKPNLNTKGTAAKRREPNETIPTKCYDSENYVCTGYICAGCRADIILCKAYEDIRKLIKVNKK